MSGQFSAASSSSAVSGRLAATLTVCELEFGAAFDMAGRSNPVNRVTIAAAAIRRHHSAPIAGGDSFADEGDV
jgi:hypothetical protein